MNTPTPAEELLEAIRLHIMDDHDATIVPLSLIESAFAKVRERAIQDALREVRDYHNSSLPDGFENRSWNAGAALAADIIIESLEELLQKPEVPR